jgi:hypothetical protein
MRMVIFVIGLLIQFSANACSCRLGTPEQKLRLFPQVFVGVISELTALDHPKPKEPPPLWNFDSDPPIRVKFKIEELFKGVAGEITLDTVYNQQSCNGYFFHKPGERYLIYAFAKGENFDVKWCGGAIPQESGKDFDAERKRVRQEKKLIDRLQKRCAKMPERAECIAEAQQKS